MQKKPYWSGPKKPMNGGPNKGKNNRNQRGGKQQKEELATAPVLCPGARMMTVTGGLNRI